METGGRALVTGAAAGLGGLSVARVVARPGTVLAPSVWGTVWFCSCLFACFLVFFLLSLLCCLSPLEQ